MTDNTARLLTIQQAAMEAGIGRSKFYELIQRGDIRTVHIGRAVRVPRIELDRWITRQLAEAGIEPEMRAAG